MGVDGVVSKGGPRGERRWFGATRLGRESHMRLRTRAFSFSARGRGLVRLAAAANSVRRNVPASRYPVSSMLPSKTQAVILTMMSRQE